MAKIAIMGLNIPEILNRLHINDTNEAFSTGTSWGSSAGAAVKTIISPTNGKLIAAVKTADETNYNQVVEQAARAFLTWRNVPCS